MTNGKSLVKRRKRNRLHLRKMTIESPETITNPKVLTRVMLQIINSNNNNHNSPSNRPRLNTNARQIKSLNRNEVSFQPPLGSFSDAYTHKTVSVYL